MNDACNIGPQNRKRRKWFGVIFLVLAGITSGYLIATNADVFSRVLVLPLFALGYVNLLQAQTGVCVYHAYKKTVGEE